MSTDDDKPARPYYPTPGDLIAAILGPLAESAPEGFVRANADAGRPAPPRDRDAAVSGAPVTRLDPDGDAELLDDLPREPRRYDPRSVRFVLDGQPVVMSQGGAVARAALDRLARDAVGLSRFPGRDAAIALNPAMEVQYVAVWSDPQPRRAFRRERRAIIREARARICPDAFDLRVACLTAPERRGLQVRGFDVLRRALSVGRYRLGLVMGHLATLDPRRLP